MLCAWLQASIAHHSGIAHILSMFFRDDVMAWNKRVQGKAPKTQPLKPAQLKSLVQRNVKDCIERLQVVSCMLPIRPCMCRIGKTVTDVVCCILCMGATSVYCSSRWSNSSWYTTQLVRETVARTGMLRILVNVRKHDLQTIRRHRVLSRSVFFLFAVNHYMLKAMHV